MRVLHVLHWPRSGIGALIRDVVRHRAPDMQHDVLCLAPGDPVTGQIRDAGARVFGPLDSPTWPAAALALRTRMRSERYDVVHSHSFTPRLVSALVARGTPHVTSVHTAYLYFSAPDTRSTLKRRVECAAVRALRARVACVSEDVLRSLPCPAMRSRAFVIHNGIDLARVRAAAAEPAGAPRGNPLLVAVGRLDWEKAFDRLIPAVARVRQRFPEVRLVICGTGNERAALERLARQHAVDDVVEFMGHVPNPMPYVRAADAFVSSSVQEGFALTAAEAMALGRPVVATPAAGVGSVLRDGVNAILASGFETENVADALVRALSDEQRLRDVADNGRAFAEEYLDVRRAVASYERLYRDMAVSR